MIHETIQIYGTFLLVPCSESPYAAFIHALHECGHTGKAKEIFLNMERNVYIDEIRPNIECFQVHMLSALKSQDWRQVIEYHNRMVDAGISLDHNATLTVLLASCHVGTKEELLHRIEISVEHKAQFNFESFHLCLESLFPTIHQECDTSIDRIRLSFRLLGEKQSNLREECIKLIRSLRLAELEDGRKASSKLSSPSSDVLWRQVMIDLGHLSRKLS